MSQPKLKPTPQPRFSAADIQLKRFLELDGQIKVMTKELDQLKDALKHEGSHSTHNYVVLVEERSRSNPPSLANLIATYGERVRELCTESTYKTVKVSPKVKE
jgi:hypothetical protein